MNEFDFNPGAFDLGFDSAALGGDAQNGVYIPSVMDCMSCGVCVAQCPTYKAKPDENYSPRGRIRLIERVINKAEVLADDELQALTACTLCRACEAVCPSQMAYQQLYYQAIETLDFKPARTWSIRLLMDTLVPSRVSQNMLATLIAIYQRSGLQTLIHKLPFSVLRGDIKRFEQLLPSDYVSKTVGQHYPAIESPGEGNVVLFTGCVANVLDRQTHHATINLLNALGFAVDVPKQQVCCGAMYAHNGEIDRAKSLAQQNMSVFTQQQADAIVFNASGCGAFLTEYSELLTEQPDVATAFMPIDAMDFIANADGFDELNFNALNLTVAVHEPCSQRNGLKNQSVIYQLLSRIPQIKLIQLPDNNICCGAGGIKMLTQAELAEPLRDEKVAALVDSGADILVSSNLTCAKHLANGIRHAGQEIEVMHPIRLLAQQLL